MNENYDPGGRCQEIKLKPHAANPAHNVRWFQLNRNETLDSWSSLHQHMLLSNVHGVWSLPRLMCFVQCPLAWVVLGSWSAVSISDMWYLLWYYLIECYCEHEFEIEFRMTSTWHKNTHIHTYIASIVQCMMHTNVHVPFSCKEHNSSMIDWGSWNWLGSCSSTWLTCSIRDILLWCGQCTIA